uniref:Innexin n=1 Tax=Schistocephalus solidus TaxID=70667 RepID=A0A0X3PRR2_SCHSO
MVGSEFIEYISKFHVTTYAGVEDFADKFNFLITVMVLSLCTVIITVKQYIMKPIACYIATEVGGSNLLNYVENYCWVQGTLPISYAGKMPSTEQEWQELDKQKILYYQWVPFVLGLQCVLFYIPRVIWQAICYNRTGTDLENLISQSVNAVHAKENDRQGIVNDLVAMVEHLLFQQQKRTCMKPSSSLLSRRATGHPEQVNILEDSSNSHPKRRLGGHYRSMPMLGQHRGTFIVAAYMLVKLLYLANAIGQIFLMQSFLGFNNSDRPFGFQVLDNIIRGHDWEMTLVFPRVGFCFTQMKLLGVQTNGVTAQCALPVNMLNEKIYIFLWWWILAAIIITLISFVLWLIRLCSRSREANYIAKYIDLGDDLIPYDEHDAFRFATCFLRRDGMFLIRMIRVNAGDVIAAEVVNRLWERYLQRQKEGTRNPLNNYLVPPVGWNTPLEKGGNTDDPVVRNRAEAGKEQLYPPVEPHAPSAPNDGEKRNPRSIV